MNLEEKKRQFTEVYERESDSLFRFIYFRVSDRELSLDMVQEVFTRMWRSINDGKEIPNPRAFLFLTARNLVIDWYRKKKSESLDELMNWNDEGDEGDLPYEPGDPDAHSDMQFKAEAAVVLEGLKKIAPHYAEVVYLRYIEGLEPQQIGTMIGTNANTVSIRLTRGLEALRKVLKV